MIRAGTEQEIRKESGDWVFVDIGFAAEKKSCGLIIGSDSPQNLSFAEMVKRLVGLARSKAAPLNIVIEAPLSVAFLANGNPCGRKIERSEETPATGMQVPVALFWWQRCIC